MAKQQVFKLRGEGVNGYSPPVIRTTVKGGFWQAYSDGSPVALELNRGP